MSPAPAAKLAQNPSLPAPFFTGAEVAQRLAARGIAKVPDLEAVGREWLVMRLFCFDLCGAWKMRSDRQVQVHQILNAFSVQCGGYRFTGALARRLRWANFRCFSMEEQLKWYWACACAATCSNFFRSRAPKEAQLVCIERLCEELLYIRLRKRRDALRLAGETDFVQGFSRIRSQTTLPARFPQARPCPSFPIVLVLGDKTDNPCSGSSDEPGPDDLRERKPRQN